MFHIRRPTIIGALLLAFAAMQTGCSEATDDEHRAEGRTGAEEGILDDEQTAETNLGSDEENLLDEVTSTGEELDSEVLSQLDGEEFEIEQAVEITRQLDALTDLFGGLQDEWDNGHLPDFDGSPFDDFRIDSLFDAPFGCVNYHWDDTPPLRAGLEFDDCDFINGKKINGQANFYLDLEESPVSAVFEVVDLTDGEFLMNGEIVMTHAPDMSAAIIDAKLNMAYPDYTADIDIQDAYVYPSGDAVIDETDIKMDISGYEIDIHGDDLTWDYTSCWPKSGEMLVKTTDNPDVLIRFEGSMGVRMAYVSIPEEETPEVPVPLPPCW